MLHELQEQHDTLKLAGEALQKTNDSLEQVNLTFRSDVNARSRRERALELQLAEEKRARAIAERNTQLAITEKEAAEAVHKGQSEARTRELQDARTENSLVKTLLGREGLRRVAAEVALEDFKRETEATFIVPAMLDAFEKITHLSRGGDELADEDRELQ